MSLVLQSSGGGQITIQEPATASNFTQTLPAATGTVMVSGNQPAFSAYQSSAQSITASTWTKILFQTEEFDTALAFDSTTNYRFTPQVAGYYQINAAVSSNVSALIFFASAIYKNGSLYKQGSSYSTTTGVTPTTAVSSLVYLNGSTDYVEIYAIQASTGNTNNGIERIYVNGSVVRAA